MNKKLINFIKGYTDKCEDLNKLLVTSFVRNNRLDIKGSILSNLILEDEDCTQKKIEIENLKSITSLEDVINIFELAIPKKEQTVNGAIYTPKYIRDYIVEEVFKNSDCSLDKCLCADISCGCGAFLYTVAQYIHEHTELTYTDIVMRLYGVDISNTSIERAKILLSLAALVENEELSETSFRLYASDSLTFDFMSLSGIADNGGFDIIVGNPPYVRSKHIDKATKAKLPLWPTAKVGNPDLYIPFFEMGYTLLNRTGRLGYITVNSFFKSVNARALRRFFSDKEVSMSIIDFGQQLVFKKKLAYTCLAFLSKERKIQIHYVKVAISDIQQQKQFAFSHIDYSYLDNHRGWNLNKMDVLDNIRKIEQTGEPLGDKYIIKNGIATLANNIYIFCPTHSDGKYFYFIRNRVQYRIEKDICKDIIKPNILKTEADIKEKEEKILFPYDSKYNILSEEALKNNYPCAYQYLQTFRTVLDARDKGKGDYSAWYAFGRTQAITDSGKKLLFPYMSDQPHFVYTPQQDMMIYCGYAIYNDSEAELLILKKLLESSVFDYYIKNTSKPYSTGYYSYAKNYVRFFGVYSFSEEERKYLLSLKDRRDIDSFVANKYQVLL